MGKVIQIEVPEWVDEESVRQFIKEYFGRGILSEEDFSRIKDMLEEIERSKVDEKVVEEIWHEGKVLH